MSSQRAKVVQMGTVEEEEEGVPSKGEDIVMDTIISAFAGNNRPFLRLGDDLSVLA